MFCFTVADVYNKGVDSLVGHAMIFFKGLFGAGCKYDEEALEQVLQPCFSERDAAITSTTFSLVVLVGLIVTGAF